MEHVLKISRQQLSFRAQFENISVLIALNLSIVLLAISSIDNMQSPMFVLFSFVCICIHQHFLSEYLHEATHWNLLENKFLNDFVSLFLIGIPFGTIPSLNRSSHFKHHAQQIFFNTKDVEGNRYKVFSKKSFILKILSFICGLQSVKFFLSAVLFSHRIPTSSTTNISKFWLLGLVSVHFFIIMLGFTYGFILLYIFYYFVLIAIYPVFAMFRFWGQHANVSLNNSNIAFTFNSHVSRTNQGGILDFLFFNSPIMSYHYAHHISPNLHYRQLKQLNHFSEDPNKFGKGCFDIILKVWNGLN